MLTDSEYKAPKEKMSQPHAIAVLLTSVVVLCGFIVFLAAAAGLTVRLSGEAYRFTRGHNACAMGD